MNFHDSNQFFCTLTLEKKNSTVTHYIVDLKTPISFKLNQVAQVALCRLHYLNTSQLCRNLANGMIQIACPSITGRGIKTFLSNHDSSSTPDPTDLAPDPTPDPRPDPKPDPQPKPSPQANFVTCQLENAEYDASTLCQALNVELSHKLNSMWREKKCLFKFNNVINRVEISIDGDAQLKPDDRVTVVIFYPMSKYLGLTIIDKATETFCFVS